MTVINLKGLGDAVTLSHDLARQFLNELNENGQPKDEILRSSRFVARPFLSHIIENDPLCGVSWPTAIRLRADDMELMDYLASSLESVAGTYTTYFGLNLSEEQLATVSPRVVSLGTSAKNVVDTFRKVAGNVREGIGAIEQTDGMEAEPRG